MSPAIVEMKGVHRWFGGAVALAGLDLAVRPGSIYGLVGPNGAGKTTTLKILAGLLWPDRGEVRVLGVEPRRFAAADRWRIGYLGEKQWLPPGYRVDDLVRFCAALNPRWDFALTDDLLRRFAIQPTARVKTLSMGATRKLGLVLALAARPDLVLLDEPAGGLDAVARRELLEALVEVVSDGQRSVILSTHVLSDLERVADQVGILAEGRLRVSEPLEGLKDTVKKVRFFGFPAGPPAEFEPPGAFRTSRAGEEVVSTLRLEGDSVARVAARYGCRYETYDLTLEDIFVDVAGRASEPVSLGR